MRKIESEFHPGRPCINEVLGLPRWKNRGSRYRSENADDDYRPRITSDWRTTDAPPGSIEKVLVFIDRVAKNQPLYHPEDATNYDGVYQHSLLGLK